MSVSPCQVNVSSFELNKAITFSKVFSKVKLSPSARLVLRCLADFWNPDKGLVYPGQRTISEYTGCSLRTVNNVIEELRQAGLILTIGSSGCKLKYYFSNKFFELVEVAGVVGKNCVGGCAEIAHHEQITKQINNRKNFIKRFDYGRRGEAFREGINYKSPEETREERKSVMVRDEVSPWSDKEVAIKFIQGFSEEQLKNEVVRGLVERVKSKWDL